MGVMDRKIDAVSKEVNRLLGERDFTIVAKHYNGDVTLLTIESAFGNYVNGYAMVTGYSLIIAGTKKFNRYYYRKNERNTILSIVRNEMETGKQSIKLYTFDQKFTG